MTPRWVVMYSSISCSMFDLIDLPLISVLASLKSKTTEHCRSLATNRSCRSAYGTSENGGRRTISTRSVTWNREERCLRGVLAIGIVSLGVVAMLVGAPSPPDCGPPRSFDIGPALGGVAVPGGAAADPLGPRALCNDMPPETG